MRQNERRTVSWRKGYAAAIELTICAKEFLTFDEWVRRLVRRELAQAGLVIEEPRPGRKGALDPEQPQLPAPVGPARITEDVVRASRDHGGGATYYEQQRAAEDAIRAANPEPSEPELEQPLAEPPPPPKPEDESELDAHDREISEKMKELERGDDSPF